jgi:spermidine/putrescine transport system ATP-binding protein
LRLRKSRAAAGSGDIAFGVRPEKTRIHNTDPGASAAGNSIGPGTLLDVSFTGVATQYLVDVPDAGRWAVYEQNLDLDRIDSRPGDTVWISWDPGHAFGVRP